MDLVKLEKDEPVTTTKIISEGLGIAHRHIKKHIKEHEKKFLQLGLLVACATESIGGRPEEIMQLNEPQSAFLLTLLKNTEIVVDFKFELTKEFFRMRKALNEISIRHQNAEWQEIRQNGKAIRRQETDVIKEFVEYATLQGSRNSKMYYANITKMQNKALFFLAEKHKNIRDLLTTQQLMVISAADVIVEKALRDGMEQKKFYKDIFLTAKERVEGFAAYIPRLEIPTMEKPQIDFKQAM